MSDKAKASSRLGRLRGGRGKKADPKDQPTQETPQKVASLETALPDFDKEAQEAEAVKGQKTDQSVEKAAKTSESDTIKDSRQKQKTVRQKPAEKKPQTAAEADTAKLKSVAAEMSQAGEKSETSKAQAKESSSEARGGRRTKADIPALALKDVRRIYKQGHEKLEVLKGVSFSIRAGEMVALVGPSGAGKSTLLHMAGLLEQPDSGEVFIGGEKCTGISDNKRTQLRLRQLGFVYQFHHLLPEFSALENIMLPQLVSGLPRSEARRRARELLSMVNLKHRENHRPARLSGGEQQRVAVARALANVPSVLMADEPTGNLDPHTAEHVFEMMRMLVRHIKLAALVATHNLDLAQRMDRILILRDGYIEEA